MLPLITGNPDITAGQLLTVQAVSGVITLLIFHFAKWFTADRGYLSSRPRMALLWSGMAAAGMIIPAEWIMEHMPELPNIAAKQFNILMTSPEDQVRSTCYSYKSEGTYCSSSVTCPIG